MLNRIGMTALIATAVCATSPAPASAQSRRDQQPIVQDNPATPGREIDPVYAYPRARERETGSALVLHEDNGGIRHEVER